ncbi:P-loop containing nucleoside triphosphate hydrolase protein [Daldinia eschscholtzii]|nr:P-loop containing nucleoside triphosphate hydrolase protein [Daldinia eschscholtzii]
MDHLTEEERLEARVKNLEKIALITFESLITAFNTVPIELRRAKSLVIEILEGNQSLRDHDRISTHEGSTKSTSVSANINNDAQSSTEIGHNITDPEDTNQNVGSSYQEESPTLVDTSVLEEVQAQLDDETDVANQLRELLKEERRRSQLLATALRDIQGNIRVLCRIRPPGEDIPTEDLVDFGPQERGDFSQYWGKMAIPTTKKNVAGTIVPDKPREYHFERVFSPSDTNEDVFNHISDLIESSMEGQRIVMFAYGQTGSGKTYTLSHNGLSDIENGVIPRALGLMFKIAGNPSSGLEYSIAISIQEVYMNQTFDLLEVTETKQKEKRIIANTAQKRQLQSLEEAVELIKDAMSYRETSRTSMNASSSRSHMILTFEISRVSREDGRKLKSGTLSIVDLAGSERPNEMGLTGNTRQEGIIINNSLMSLIKLIHSIGAGTNIVYDSQLVKVLRPSIVPETKVVMFVMISPLKKDLSVSFQTLDKGQEASNAKMTSVGRTKSAFSSPIGQPGSSTRPNVSTPSPSSGRGTSPSRGTPSRRGTISSRANSPSRGRGRK